MPLARRANTDPVLYYQTQDKWVREYWVHVEYMKLLKDEVRNCYRREGVNHYENCRDLVQEYYKRTKAPSALRPAAPRTRPCPHPPAPLAPCATAWAGAGNRCRSRTARALSHRRWVPSAVYKLK